MRAAIILMTLLVGSAAADDPKAPQKKPDETTVEIVKPPPPPPPKPDPDKPGKPAAPDLFAEYTGSSAAARELFNEARKLLNEGKQAEACAKLTASFQQEEATSTQVGLAACRESQGKFAEARRMYDDAAKRSRESGFEDRAQQAGARAKALDDKLAMIVIRLAAPIAQGTVVTVNDHVLETAPEIREGVDAGDVTVVARGPTGVKSEKKFRVFLHTTTNVDVPTLQERTGGRNPIWIGGSVVLVLGGIIAIGAGNGPIQLAGGVAIAAGIGVFLLAPRDKVTVVPMATSSGGAGAAVIGRF